MVRWCGIGASRLQKFTPLLRRCRLASPEEKTQRKNKTNHNCFAVKWSGTDPRCMQIRVAWTRKGGNLLGHFAGHWRSSKRIKAAHWLARISLFLSSPPGTRLVL